LTTYHQFDKLVEFLQRMQPRSQRVLALFTVSLLLIACDEKEPIELPVSTFEMLSVEEIQYTDALLKGELRSRSGESFERVGFVWHTQPKPTLKNGIVRFLRASSNDIGTTVQSATALQLLPNQKYFVTTFMISKKDTVYGSDISLTTLHPSPGDFLDFPGHPRENAVSFVINGKGYMGLGRYYDDLEEILLKDFWELDLASRVWTQKNDFPAGGRNGAVAFVVGDKGYVATGFDGSWEGSDRFYQYDPVSDQWTFNGVYPGGRMAFSVAFSIAGKGYVGAGMTFESKAVIAFYEYDPTVDPSRSWTRKADFPGDPVLFPMAFSIGNKGYVGFGHNADLHSHQLWEFDPSVNSWSRKQDCPTEKIMSLSSAFVIGGKAYVGMGGYPYVDKKIWRYDPITNTWTNDGLFRGSARYAASVFTLSDRALIGIGYNGQDGNVYFGDFVQYIPD
jgi:N-acetylneuraminic acid mutarotase